MPVNINLLSDDTIARGITPPDIGNFGTAFTGTQDYLQKQALQNLFAGSKLPRLPDGSIDWYKASEMALQAQGAPGLAGAEGIAKFGLLQNLLRNRPGSGNPGLPPQPDTPGPQSALPDEPQPTSIQRPGGQAPSRVAAKTYDTPLNLGEVTGVQRGPVEGNPALLSYASEPTPPEPFAGRFNASYDQSNEDPSLPPNARPMEGQQVAGNAPRAPTRIFIPGPNPEGDQTEQRPQSPTGDLGGVPGQSRTSGGLEISERNAQRFEKAAGDLYDYANGLDLLQPGAGAAQRAKADGYMAQVKIIREGLTKNFELSPEQKAARDTGTSLLEYQRRQEAGKLDAKNFQEQMTSINNAAQNAAVGMQKAQLGKQLTQAPDFYSGPLNEYATQFRQFQNIFGINPAGAAPNEIFQKVTNDMLQEQIKAMGQSGVGRVLMSEVAVMQRALASLGITDVSNRALMEMTARTYRKAMDIAKLTENMPPNSQQLNRAILGYLKAHPMFSDEERSNPALLGSKEPPPQAAQWNKQQVMQWGAQNGLKPGDPFMFNGQLRAIPRGP